MGEQFEKTWVMKKFSSLQEERYYSRPITVADCNWHLLVYPKGDRNDGYLAVYLELANPESLPLGWTREVKFSLTLVNKAWGKSNHVLGAQCFFDAKKSCWGYNGFISLTKLHAKGEGFLVNNKLIILAKVHVLPAAIVLPEEPVKIIEPPSSKEGNQASDASVSKSLGDSSCQMAEKTENASKENLDNDDASEEGLDDDDDDTSDEGTDDDGSCEEDPDDGDTSSPVSDDEGKDICPFNQSNSLEDAAHTVGNHGTRCNSVAAETEVSNGENDDAPKEDVDDEASSHVSNDSARNGSTTDHVKSLEDASLTVENALEDASHTVENHGIRCNSVAAETEVSNGENDVDAPAKDVKNEASSLVSNDSARNGSSLEQVKSLEDASQTVENGGMGFNTVASVTEIINVLRKEIQPVKETMDINGFEVVSSKVESVRRIFERHPDIAVEFRAKNQHLRNACMNFLLGIIETMCQSLEELSNEDLVEADIALTYLRDAGFKVDWLEEKLDKLKENKEEERSSLARLQEIEDVLRKWKQKCSELEALAEKEKVELSATRSCMCFDDLV